MTSQACDSADRLLSAEQGGRDGLYQVAPGGAEGVWSDLLRAAIPELRSGAWEVVSDVVTQVLKQRRKRIVFSLLSYQDAGRNGPPETAELVAKVYGSDRGAGALAALQQLWEVGFQPPAEYRVPRPYGYSPEHGTLIQARAPGVPWADFLHGDGRTLVEMSARAAAWLVRLQHCLARPEPKDPEADVSMACRAAQGLVADFPQLARRMGPLADHLARRLRAHDGAPVPAHGDYHPKNVFLAPGHVTVIDFDTFGLRPAAADVGYCIGQLLIMSSFRTGSFEPGIRAALAFWRQYERDGLAAWPQVAVHVARTFLQSLYYELCTLRNGRVELLDVWPNLMEDCLDGAESATLESLGRHYRGLSLRQGGRPR